MKARIDENNVFKNAYADNYQFPEDWILVDITEKQLEKICELGKAKLENDAWVKIDPTQEEIDLENKQIYDKKYIEINNEYNRLWVSSLARATGKLGRGLSEGELQKIREEYEDTNLIAQRCLNNDNDLDDNPIYKTLLFETEYDFTGQILFDTATALGIEDLSGDRIKVYCRIVVEKYRLGSELWKLLKGFCRNFRSKMITMLDKGNDLGVEQGFLLSNSITNETDIDEIVNLVNQFEAL